MPDQKVYSVTDFKRGLDVRRTPLTAPGGSLRIMENAVLNQGGEVEKRQAFVYMTTAEVGVSYLIGHGGKLHVFGFASGISSIPPGLLPVPIEYHYIDASLLSGVSGGIGEILDVEPYDTQFYVAGKGATNGVAYNFNVFPGLPGQPLPSPDPPYWYIGSYVRTWKSKMYRTDGGYLRFSGVGDPVENDPASVTHPGAGFINLALNDPDGEDLVSMEVFFDKMAVMARLETQLWVLDPDPSKDTLAQLLRIGIVSPRSALQFGTGDVLFLSDSGVRSLKAQSLSNAAAVSDVGSAVDMLLVPVIRANNELARKADAVVQPIQGRYWLAIGDTIYVLSYFPAGEITGWSTFKPGFTVQNFAVVNNMVFCMDADNKIYLYGGVDQNTYDSCKVTIRTPHLSADNPTQNKRIKSVDVMCQGTWTVQIGMLPNNTEAFEMVATIDNNTFGLQSIPFAGYGTHFGVHLEHQAPGPALMAALHFNIQEGVVK